MKSVLIFDLDDTLFETRSIVETHVAAILDRFRNELKTTQHASKIDAIISDVWKFPFDDVSSKYGFENEMLEKFAQAVNDQTLQYRTGTLNNIRGKLVRVSDENNPDITLKYYFERQKEGNVIQVNESTFIFDDAVPFAR